MKRAALCVVIAVVSGGLAPLSAFAVDMGSAGPFREMGGPGCAKGGRAQMAGECEPAPVDATLPAEEQSRALTDRAFALFALIRGPQALGDLSRAMAFDPSNLVARHLRARYLITTGGDFAIAEADMRAAIAVAPDDPDLHATLAYLLKARADLPDAMTEIEASLSRKPDNADALLIKADLLITANKLEDAAAALDKASALAPSFERVAMRDAEIHLSLDEPRKAEAVLTALLIQEHSATAYARRANARLALGDGQGALNDLDAALGPSGGPYLMAPAGPVFTDLVLKRAMLLHRFGRGAEAMADLGALLDYGGTPAALRLQLFLRKNGFPEVQLNGSRSETLDQALKACFLNEACGKSIVRGI